MNRLRAVAGMIVVLTVGLCSASGCSDDDGGQANNNNHNMNTDRDGGVDAAPTDGTLPDGQLPDGTAQDGGGDGGVVTNWSIRTSNLMFDNSSGLIAAHPTSPTTLAILVEADEFNSNFEVHHTSDGVTYSPTVITTFTPSLGFYAIPIALSFDPADGNNVVASTEPNPAPSMDEAIIHAWSSSGGSSYDRSSFAFTNPWPPDGMIFVGGTPSEVVWRASRYFFFSTSLGEFNTRSAELSPLPSGCGSIWVFDIPTDDHDTVGIVCTDWSAHVCDLTTDVCQAIPVPGSGTVSYLTFAPSNPSYIYMMGNNGTSDVLYRSTDGGASASEVHTFDGHFIRVYPGNHLKACAVSLLGLNPFHCTPDGGTTWNDMTPPNLQLPGMTLVRNFTFGLDGAIWALAHPGVIHHPPI